MHIGILSAWASRLGGGVFEAVVTHGQLLRQQGFETSLFALEDQHSAEDSSRFPGVVRTFSLVGPKSVGYAPALLGALNRADLDVLHLHGLWMYPSHAGERWAAQTGRPFVISPHGMLDPWIVSRNRWKKQLARIGYERRSWSKAHLFHALTITEAADIRRQTSRTNIAVIPNAVVQAPTKVIEQRAKRILFLGRIHPKKNLSNLVRGWAALKDTSAGWKLIIAGWGEAEHISELEVLLAQVSSPNIEFIGPIFGAAKAQELANAKFFILPSYSEGLPLAILEAWASGVPTIQSLGCNLPEGFEGGAAVQTGTDPSTIMEALQQAIGMSDARYVEMTNNARSVAMEKFSLAAVGSAWSDAYGKLTN